MRRRLLVASQLPSSPPLHSVVISEMRGYQVKKNKNTQERFQMLRDIIRAKFVSSVISPPPPKKKRKRKKRNRLPSKAPKPSVFYKTYLRSAEWFAFRERRPHEESICERAH